MIYSATDNENDVGFKTEGSNRIILSCQKTDISIFYIDIIIFERFCLTKKSGKQNGEFSLKCNYFTINLFHLIIISIVSILLNLNFLFNKHFRNNESK